MSPEYKANVYVNFHENLHDPQSKAVEGVVRRVVSPDIKKVVMGKRFDIFVNADDRKKARELVKKTADDILSNPVIEAYKIVSLREVKPKNSP